MQPQSIDPTAPKDFRLGVLFVHGIGTQRARNTLVQWGDQLVRVIKDATDGEVLIGVERARPGDAASGQPADSEVTIDSKDASERWLMSEAWWAEAFPAPTYGELVSWSVRAVPWSLVVGIAHRYNRVRTQASPRRRVLAWLIAALQLTTALVFAPFFVLILMLMLLLGLLPIPQLRSLILSAQSLLTGAIGDSLAFVDSPHRHALIRTRIVESIERLHERCDRTIVVAHSQGAAVALDAIDLLAVNGAAGGQSKVPDALVTFGSGVNQLASLRALFNKPREIAPMLTGMIMALGALLLGGWMVLSVRDGRLEIIDLLHAAAVVLVGFGVGSAAVAGALRLRNRNEKAVMSLLAGIFIATIAGMQVYASIQDLPLGPVNMILLAVFAVLISVVQILSKGFMDVITAQMSEPPGLAKWVDLYSSADPVPNGPTRLFQSQQSDQRSPSVLQATEIWNRGSMLADHTSYWENLDDFVLRVARACAQVAQSPWSAAFPPDTDLAHRRSGWRVGLLRSPRWFVWLAWLAVFFILAARGASELWLPYSFPKWLPAFALGPLLTTELLVLILAAAWANVWLVELPWKFWTRGEQAMFITSSSTAARETTPSGIPFLPFFGMGVAMGTAFLAFYCATQPTMADVRALFDSWDDVLRMVLMTVGYGGMFALLTVWLRKGGPVYDVESSRELTEFARRMTPPDGLDATPSA
jgi:hypothetical protein